MSWFPFPLKLISCHPFCFSSQPRQADGRLPGQVHYESLCMRAVNQSIGRAIRHSRDYACIVLADMRYERPSVIKHLPQWIASQVQVCKTFGQGFAAIRKVVLALSGSCSYVVFPSLAVFQQEGMKHFNNYAQLQNNTIIIICTIVTKFIHGGDKIQTISGLKDLTPSTHQNYNFNFLFVCVCFPKRAPCTLNYINFVIQVHKFMEE